MPVYLAAYGTLMSGEVNALSPRTRACLVSLGVCRIPGRMVRVWDGSGHTRIDYPGLLADSAGFVSGELFRIEGDVAGVLADMDVYEDCHPGDPDASQYLRRAVGILSPAGDAVTAWVYYYNRPAEGLEPIPEGRWQPRSPRPVVEVVDETKPYNRLP